MKQSIGFVRRTAKNCFKTGACCAGLLFLPLILMGQETPAVSPDDSVPSAQQLTTQPLGDTTLIDEIATRSADAEDPIHTAEDDLRNREKKRKAFAGLAALGGIAILGVGIIAATMMWATRLRRLARIDGPSQKTVGNDFWFLKPPKPIASERELSDRRRPPYTENRDRERPGNEHPGNEHRGNEHRGNEHSDHENREESP